MRLIGGAAILATGAAITASYLGRYIKAFLDSFLVGVSGVGTLGACWNRAWPLNFELKDGARQSPNTSRDEEMKR